MPSLIKNSSRQEPAEAWLDFTFADLLTTAIAYDALDLPVNAIVVGGDLVVTAVWNTATSAALAVGDVTVTNRYGAGIDLKALGRTALTITGLVHTSTENLIRLLPTYVGGAATVGSARLRVAYITKGRSLYTFGQGR